MPWVALLGVALPLQVQSFGADIPNAHLEVERAQKAFAEGHMFAAAEGFERALEHVATLPPDRALMARYFAGVARMATSNEAAMAHFRNISVGSAPLAIAAHFGDTAVAKLLLDEGMDVDSPAGDGGHALYRPAHFGNAEMVRLLVSRGADVTSLHPMHQDTALRVAESSGHREVSNLLIVAGACTHEKRGPSAVQRGGVRAIFERLPAMLPVGTRFTLLHRDPWLATIDDILSDDEITHMLEKVACPFSPSLINDGCLAASLRDSDSCEATNNHFRSDEVVKRLTSRISAAVGIPAENAEHWQLVRYRQGQFYSQHHDGELPAYESTSHGNRVLTVFVYLEEPAEGGGGGTRFNDLGITVAAVKGRAVLWANVMDQDTSLPELRVRAQPS